MMAGYLVPARSRRVVIHFIPSLPTQTLQLKASCHPHCSTTTSWKLRRCVWVRVRSAWVGAAEEEGAGKGRERLCYATSKTKGVYAPPGHQSNLPLKDLFFVPCCVNIDGRTREKLRVARGARRREGCCFAANFPNLYKKTWVIQWSGPLCYEFPSALKVMVSWLVIKGIGQCKLERNK